jgi:hypothetical protein
LSSLEILRQGPGSGSRSVYIDKTVGYLADLYRTWGKSDQAAVYLAMLDSARR